METKQIWLTVIISLVVAVIAAWIVASVVAKPSTSPLLGPKVNATYTNATPLLPDLIINGMKIKTIGIQNISNETYYRIVFTTSVKNVGNARADYSYTSSYIWNWAGCPMYQYTSPLNPGQVTQVNCTGLITAGTYPAFGLADWTNRIRESNEYNNDFNTTVTIP